MRRYSLMFFLIMFLIGTDTFLISPLLPTLADMYGISTSISGWMVSAYAIGYACFALISGPISDGLDRKKVMLAGLFAFAISTFLCGFSTTFSMMLFFRFLAGISASFVTPQVWASIPVIVEKKSIVKVMGYATAGLSVSQLVGIPIGSYLAVASWRTPFFVISGAAVLLLILNFFLLPSLELGQKVKQTFWATYINVLHNPKALSYLLAYLIFQTGSFTSITFISTWFTNSFGLTLAGVGTAMIAIGAGNLIGSLFGSKLVEHLGLEHSFLVELIALIMLYLILPFVNTFWLAELMLTVAFLFNGFIFPLFMTTLQSTTTNARSTISSLSNAAMYFGETLAGVIGGVLFKQFHNYLGISLFAAVMILIALLVYAKSGIFKSEVANSTEN
ncbi:MFS transporter [Lactiplantibacillus pentosus]|uniref:Transporter protein (Transporter, major facilitator superfamily MFS_1) n=1 Tax=Lactiplantibacillus pentosus IG1 TaxID=1042160 RepID=G0M5M3_LACPE|nr:MFS transporter [Lactiplantibacillus pentosus]CCC17563.1 transporter protein (transporter, major facilitator superfamily MFS_1) [Lactiplantibacillus pentosus IG1]MCT3282706.1 MFS transporter [Lactiplantibacillus pentosus]MCT3303798.1 MFS transporter [Lactiplantibacillus pentosus]PRO82003.1 MFS transporter [Lactiplantibacillus pentosus]PRO83639.1 MFS transporter [Lactiplantibacillus pentosus]